MVCMSGPGRSLGVARTRGGRSCLARPRFSAGRRLPMHHRHPVMPFRDRTRDRAYGSAGHGRLPGVTSSVVRSRSGPCGITVCPGSRRSRVPSRCTGILSGSKEISPEMRRTSGQAVCRLPQTRRIEPGRADRLAARQRARSDTGHPLRRQWRQPYRLPGPRRWLFLARPLSARRPAGPGQDA